MVLKRESVTTRLAELDTVIHELRRYENITAGELQADLSQRFTNVDRSCLCQPRGRIEIKGKRPMETWFLLSEKSPQGQIPYLPSMPGKTNKLL